MDNSLYNLDKKLYNSHIQLSYSRCHFEFLEGFPDKVTASQADFCKIQLVNCESYNIYQKLCNRYKTELLHLCNTGINVSCSSKKSYQYHDFDSGICNKNSIMNNAIAEIKDPIMTGQPVMTSPGIDNIQTDLSGTHEAIDKLIAEGGESFYNYVEWIGLIEDPNLIVLPSENHYYFDNNDLKNMNTLINLKQLNHVKNIASFFQSIIKIIPSNSNFIGCFLDNKTQYRFANNNILSQYRLKHRVDPFENGITSRHAFLNTAYSLMDSKTNRYLTKRNVSVLLNKQGFKVLDMKELNGLTYFHAQKSRDYMAA